MHMQPKDVVSFKYLNGKGSVDPGKISRRVVIVTEKRDGVMYGIDLTKNAEIRAFSRSGVSDLKLIGRMV